MKRHGFTLTELLVVIAIIATLAGIGFPLTRSFIGKSRQSACLGQLRSLGVGLQGYLQDHNQVMPTMAPGRLTKADDSPVMETVLLPYLEDPGAFRCPADREQFDKSGSSYLWNSTQNGLHVTKLAFFGMRNRPEATPLIFDKEAWHPQGVNFLYADASSSSRIRFATGN
jgi:prepilin-type N-terminal cleavage/methylation domain-containing protein/prepilin-type processing-associated H-X9-DG protein